MMDSCSVMHFLHSFLRFSAHLLSISFYLAFPLTYPPTSPTPTLPPPLCPQGHLTEAIRLGWMTLPPPSPPLWAISFVFILWLTTPWSLLQNNHNGNNNNINNTNNNYSSNNYYSNNYNNNVNKNKFFNSNKKNNNINNDWKN